MPYQINRNLSAEQNLIGLINASADYSFTGSEFTRGAPQVYTPESPDTSNTQITLTAVQGSGFKGTKTVRYRRLALGNTVTAATRTFEVSSSDNQASVEQMIAEVHNLVLGQFYLSGSIPLPGDPDTNCTIEAYADSPLYFGTCPITLTSSAVVPPPEMNTFQLRTRTSTITYANVYLADVPSALIMGNDANTSLEEWSTAFDPNVINGSPDRSLVSLTGLGTAASFFAERQPAVEGARYWEVIINNVSAGLGEFAIGTWGHPFNDANESLYVNGGADIGGAATYYESDGEIRNNNGLIMTGPALVEGDIVGIVVSDPSLPNAARFYVNGVFIGAADVTAMKVMPMVSQKDA